MSHARGRPRLRICLDCGRQDLVRSDNLAERCRSCASKESAGRASATRAKRSQRLHLRCENCGSMFPTTPSAVKAGPPRHCSRACRYDSGRVTRRCKFCGAAFSVLRSAISGRTNASGNFCSRRCYHKHLCRTERVNGRGSRWKAIRDEAIRRAPFCAICGTLHRLDVHHITPYRLSRDNSQANLIPLCKRHHSVVEGIYRDLAAERFDQRTLAFCLRLSLLERQLAARVRLRRIWKSLSAAPHTGELADRAAG